MAHINLVAAAALRKAAEDAKRDAALSKLGFHCHSNNPDARPHERQTIALMVIVEANKKAYRDRMRALK